jgi:hypothetical protein
MIIQLLSFFACSSKRITGCPTDKNKEKTLLKYMNGLKSKTFDTFSQQFVRTPGCS